MTAGLEQNLRAVRARIDAAARAAGRDPASVALLAVSKTWPADDVRALAALGQADFGENRAQELIGKAAELADLPLRWHFIGQLQRNKAAAVARLGAVVHSVDRDVARRRPRPRRAGDRAARSRCFVQVDLGGPGGRAGGPRGGGARTTCPAWPTRSPASPGLRLRGLMAVAPRGGRPGPGVRPAGRARRPGPGRPPRGASSCPPA